MEIVLEVSFPGFDIEEMSLTSLIAGSADWMKRTDVDRLSSLAIGETWHHAGPPDFIAKRIA